MGLKTVILRRLVAQQSAQKLFFRPSFRTTTLSESVSCSKRTYFSTAHVISNISLASNRSLSSIKIGDVELTSERYKGSVERGNYAHLSTKDVAYFRDLLGKNRVVTDSAEIEGHNVDWLKMVRGI